MAEPKELHELSLLDFARKVKEASSDTALMGYVNPFLVVDFTNRGAKTKSFATLDTEINPELDAQTVASPQIDVVHPPGGELQYVHYLHETGRNTMKGMISVGRSLNNDVVVSDPSVSKLHAYFTLKPEGTFLVDLGAVNGTFVGGERISKNERVAVEGSQTIQFGDVPARLFKPNDLLVYADIQLRMHEEG